MMRKIQEILDAALKKGKKRIALAAAQEESAMEAIVDAAKHGLAEPILIGDLAIIKQLAADLKADISGWLLIEEKDYAKAAAKAVELVKSGQADLVMKGILDTSVLLKAVLNKENGLNIGRLTSHVAVMEVPTYHKLFIVSDAAININPDLPGMLDIIANAVQVSKALGVEMPKVALLAAVEKVNADKMPCTATAAVISMMNQRGQIKGCLIDGPLALDNAISAESVKIKKIVSDVAGDADVLVAPDIEAANILYKCLLDLGQAKGASIVVGAAKPVILTSRADTAETKLASIALAVLSC
ncbi:MAG: phosphate butyryltransferase [Spirochaetes bacterium GWD1_61_31]|nr:MAG: phosphate butyryltransferase [Spirochaetes bacterium GWB1_60_80]OHD29310.1 MAG: phosphate butyryltransferase [Spirochaetes bacterium GWC1_61_12]OHD35818.1 MAG: phosphate butyryltransferase [Spirochaetes bacterium GWD1_61_31]OHD46759.1 MAG: phosphate butyryltransferase [Spirochaetes bacterium GWE1_60_18]OHD61211.1 MAG: phosphate butyryltransferase [Spirochaetes bacterium GWF1_60_12]